MQHIIYTFSLETLVRPGLNINPNFHEELQIFYNFMRIKCATTFPDLSENIFSYGSELHLSCEIKKKIIICFAYKDLNYRELKLYEVFFV